MRKRSFRLSNGFWDNGMKSVFQVMLIFIICAVHENGYSAEVTLGWTANKAENVAGYKVYYGNSSLKYAHCIKVTNSTSCVISGLTPGKTYYFAATAYNTLGLESRHSNQVSVYIPQDTAIINGSLSGSSNGETLQMLSASDFTYSDEAFGTTENGYYASGESDGQSLTVSLGGIDSSNILDGISGGWYAPFDVDANGYVRMAITYRLKTDRYDVDECTQVIAAVDGSYSGLNGEEYIDQICGVGDSAWQEVVLEVYLTSGTHTLSLGGFNNKKTGANEVATIIFDNIQIMQY